MGVDRNERLERDYREMLKIQDRPYLSWVCVKGEPPRVSEYLLTVRLRTYALRASSDGYTVGVIRCCTIKVSLWDSYPQVAPNIRMLSYPPVFHPCWYSKGAYCPPTPWDPACTLKDYMMQMLRTLVYDPSVSDPAAPANYKALDWYQQHRDDPAWFLCDQTALTENDPDTIAALERAAICFDEVVDTIR